MVAIMDADRDKVRRVPNMLNAQERGRLTREFDVALFIQENAKKQHKLFK